MKIKLFRSGRHGWMWYCEYCSAHSQWAHWRLAMRDADHHARWHQAARRHISHDLDNTPPGGTRRLIP